MNATIIANGQLESNARLSDLWRDATLRVAADGGARHAREQFDVPPHAVVGDFDSVDAETLRWLKESNAEMIRYPRAKDQTDLELAIDLAQSRGADDITILGAFGGQADQMLANILLLTRVPRMKISDAKSEMWLVSHQLDSAGLSQPNARPNQVAAPAQIETEIVGAIGDTVSLIPLSETVAGIETSGLVYPLRHESLMLGTTRGISNEMSAPRATLRFENGLLLVVHLFSK